jgi:tetratricopeptide (TPR) repeat protein
MPSRRNIAHVVAAALGIWIGLIPGFCFGAGILPPPDDLRLTAAEARAAAALRQFACGVYLQMSSPARFDEAAACYQEALRLQPESILALQLLVTPYLVQQRFDKVAELLAPLVRDNPAAPHLNIIYAEALQKLQREAEATAHLRRTLVAGGWREPLVLRELFLALWRAQQYADCERLLSQARRHPALRQHFALEYASAVLYSTLGHAEGRGPATLSPRQIRRLDQRALAAARRAAAVAAQAERPGDVHSLAALLLDLGDAPTAAGILGKLRLSAAADESPDPEALLLEARALQANGETDEAGKRIGLLRQFGGLRIQLYLEMAEVYADCGRLAEAAQVYEEALTRFPDATSVRLQQAYVYLRLGEPKKGLAVLLPVASLSPAGRRLLAHLYRASGSSDRALDELQKAEDAARAARDQGFFTVDVYLFGSSLCEELNRVDQAVEYARKALALGAGDAAACNFLGYLLADHRQSLEEAEGLIRRALEAEPENDAYLDSLAWVYFRQNRLAEAHETMNRALRVGLHDLDGEILDHAGDICAALHLSDLALWYWGKALEANAPKRDAIEAKIDVWSKSATRARLSLSSSE